MTVQELIEKLSKVKDKGVEIKCCQVSGGRVDITKIIIEEDSDKVVFLIEQCEK